MTFVKTPQKKKNANSVKNLSGRESSVFFLAETSTSGGRRLIQFKFCVYYWDGKFSGLHGCLESNFPSSYYNLSFPSASFYIKSFIVKLINVFWAELVSNVFDFIKLLLKVINILKESVIYIHYFLA